MPSRSPKSRAAGLQVASFEFVRASGSAALVRLDATTDLARAEQAPAMTLWVEREGRLHALTRLPMGSAVDGPALLRRPFPLRDVWSWRMAWNGDLELVTDPQAVLQLGLSWLEERVALPPLRERGAPAAAALASVGPSSVLRRSLALGATVSCILALPALAGDPDCPPDPAASDDPLCAAAPGPAPTPAPTPEPTPEPKGDATPEPSPQPTPAPTTQPAPEPPPEQPPAEPAAASGQSEETGHVAPRNSEITVVEDGVSAGKGYEPDWLRPKSGKRRTHRSAGRRADSGAKSRRKRSRAQRVKLRRESAGGTITLAGRGMRPTLPSSMFEVAPQVTAFLESIYRRAGRKFDVPWQILAAINEIETDFGRNVAVSSAGAVGWMQFMPPTWKQYGRDAGGDGVADPNDPQDAIFAAARYLNAAGASENLPRAIYAYNHAQWYVEAILLRARMIGDPDPALARLLRLRSRRLERLVLQDERITIYGCGREDIAARRIDRRVLLTLRFLAESGMHPTVTSLECGHGVYTSSGNVSEHTAGSAVDIGAINGISLAGGQGPGSIGERAVRALATLRGIMKPHQIISLMELPGTENTIAMSDHGDHIHIGFRPLR